MARRIKFRLPWEIRSARPDAQGNYTNQMLAAQSANAMGDLPDRLGIIAACASMWANALAGAECDSDELRPHLADIGLQLILNGRWAARLDVEGTRLALRPASHAEAVPGDRWRLTLDRPHRSTVWTGAAERVLWFTWSNPVGRPWLSRGPLELAKDSVQLLASASGHGLDSLRYHLRFLVTTDDDLTAEQQSQFINSIDAIYKNGSRAWVVATDGENIKPLTAPLAAESPAMYEKAERTVAAACLVPPSIVGLHTGEPRAAARRFALNVQGVANRLALLASALLERPVTINVAPDDLQAKTRAFRSLVGREGNLPVDDARRIVGI